MPEEKEEFLKAEQMAHDLLQSLTQLKGEAVSYRTSTDELDKVRVKLVDHIDAVQVLAKDTQELISILLKIGGPEILRAIKELARIMNDTSLDHAKQFKKLNIFIIVTFATTFLCLIGIVLVLLR